LHYLPRSNGIVERWIGELTKHLKYLVVGAGLKERWSDYLPLAVRILNATTGPPELQASAVRQQKLGLAGVYT
jgi:hypothetical protein